MKKIIFGALIGIMLSIGVSAHAEVTSMIGTIIDGEFPIKINGVSLQNKALTINGTSYVPVRELTEKLGAQVKFDANTGIEVTAVQQISEERKQLAEKYRQVTKNIVSLMNEKMKLEDQINIIRTTHATMDQNVDDLNKQITDKQAQIDKLVIEKQALEAQIKSQP